MDEINYYCSNPREAVKEWLNNLSHKEIMDLILEVKPDFLTEQVRNCVPGRSDYTFTDVQSDFDLTLITHGPNKIQCIKILREEKIADGLREAKDMAEAYPIKILKGISYARASELQRKFSDIGALMEIN